MPRSRKAVEKKRFIFYLNVWEQELSATFFAFKHYNKLSMYTNVDTRNQSL